MKKRMIVCALLVLCLTMAVEGTMAYYTAEEAALNVITTGELDITLVEQQLVDDKLVPYPDEAIHIMPGVAVSKIVTVENHKGPAYIRARYTITMKNAAGEIMELDATTLDKLIDILGKDGNWTYGADGWYYYGPAVATDGATEPLFEQVHFSGPNMTNEYQNCTVEILVEAQAVQVAHNGSSALEAKGWPEAEQKEDK